jgi:hypothetical protein
VTKKAKASERKFIRTGGSLGGGWRQYRSISSWKGVKGRRRPERELSSTNDKLQTTQACSAQNRVEPTPLNKTKRGGALTRFC